MGNPIYNDRVTTGTAKSLVSRLHSIFSDDLPLAAPAANLKANELDLVRGVLRMLQGFSSSVFFWDDGGQNFCATKEIYVSHLSQTSLRAILNQFIYGATCFQLVEIFVKKVERSSTGSPPTLKAFANSVSSWLKRLRDVALREEMKIAEANTTTTPTMLGLVNSLSSLCSSAEYLLQVVRVAIPDVYHEAGSSVPAGELAVHILDHLYKELNEVCLVQGGEGESYQMLLYIFVGSLLPYIEGLDSWLYDGTLDDPFEELFFYANNTISIDEAAFWEKSYLLRPLQPQKLDPGLSSVTCAGDGDKKEMADRESILLSSSVKGTDQNEVVLEVCPLFMRDIAKAIVSAGKSLQLIRHVPGENKMIADCVDSYGRHVGGSDLSGILCRKSIGGLTLSEVFSLSLVGLIGDRDHISMYLKQDSPWNPAFTHFLESRTTKQKLAEGNDATSLASTCSEKIWCKFLDDRVLQKKESYSKSAVAKISHEVKDKDIAHNFLNESPLLRSFCPENPVITVCQTSLLENSEKWNMLNLGRNFHLPSLNDENLREAIFGVKDGTPYAVRGTDFTMGFQFGESEYIRSEDDEKTLGELYFFPTILPSFQEDLCISKFLPFQRNSTLVSRVLDWIGSFELKATPLPLVIMQECLIVYIKKQVDYIGRHILLKLMNGWRLMDELGVLRAIYLLGSGDLLQQFLTVLFEKLDKGESWDDDFELNTILQESIRNSADGMLLSAPDSLVVSITKHHVSSGDAQHNAATLVSTPHKGRNQLFGVDALDLLKFTYKVSWPLELIANTEAIKKYNQVMGFLLKVKRAKFVLDKARRLMWKGRSTAAINHKHHWLVEQKLLHFVDAFHQYVMDRVFHGAWHELCEGMASAGSLDEVIDVHEAYLLAIQRQCFVVPDKLWALIASRIKNILGLALDFYSIQQTLSSGGGALAIKARCEMEVDRIEKQFDDCIAFLLRVLSFKLNVGHFPHLADLVTRINYNYYYMSDSGNLLTVPGAESAVSKLGKGLSGQA
ncbi:gamma-tubulin complex component 5-like [Macadamia integrifolia]|uniref:gamma-tubulin complex component 5-like n=1 Tax=Macadamia integrifolia TaxID=60698 RepID=UPI001C4F6AEC|nr:gamma-tubulin complex component 5-like [Macadamia integrifolia]XP_042508369.1 gamma-tubulin complex component 5-like [Macadamia integrifolia]